MAKVEVFCKVKRKVVKMDKRLADALVKMNRASYDTKVETVYPNKMMVSETVVEKPRRGRNKKQKEVTEDVQAQIEELNKLFVPEDTVDSAVVEEVSNEDVTVFEEISETNADADK